MSTKKITEGGAGMAPPPDAPQETTQPLTQAALDQQKLRARNNEKTLAPFNPVKTGAPIPPPVAKVAELTPVSELASDFFGADTGGDGTILLTDPIILPSPELPDPPTDAGGNLTPELPPLSAEDRARMPAASDSDSPTKGILPTLVPPKGDKFDGIDRGGFGSMDDSQYFPLSGDELLQLALALMDDLAAKLKNDLRCSIALTYPRIRVRLALEVEGHAEDADSGFVVERIHVPKDGAPGSTAKDYARRMSDEMVFVVQSMRQEFTEDGEVAHPPDAIRDELGLAKPRHVMGSNFDVTT